LSFVEQPAWTPGAISVKLSYETNQDHGILQVAGRRTLSRKVRQSKILEVLKLIDSTQVFAMSNHISLASDADTYVLDVEIGEQTKHLEWDSGARNTNLQYFRNRLLKILNID
jgi:hypothetical protein